VIEHVTAAKIQKYFEKKTFIKEKIPFASFFYTKRVHFSLCLRKKSWLMAFLSLIILKLINKFVVNKKRGLNYQLFVEYGFKAQ